MNELAKPSISIIMGVLNCEDYIMAELSIGSVLNQTFEDFELIICFDGSSMKTIDNIKKVVGPDDRVHYLSNERNMGLAYSLNRCLKISKGKYIARMDIDDYISLDRLDIQKKYLDKNPNVDFISNNAYLFNDKGVWSSRTTPVNPDKNDFLFNSPFIHASAMIRHNVLLSVSGYRVSRETYRMEDYDLWMRLYNHGYNGVNLEDYLYFIREDANAVSRRKYKYRIDEAIVRFKGFKSLGLLPRGFPFVIKPLIVGLIPNKILHHLKGEKR